jgi:hypothetical protein
MRRPLLLVLTLLSVLGGAAGAAQAVVVDTGAAGKFGVALVPGTRDGLATIDVPPVTSSGACNDPSLPSDFGSALPSGSLCWQGGPVIHSNETFAVTWDPFRRYWQDTRNYVEKFLSDVAAGSGSLTSPFGVTSQYTDTSGRAAYASLYGGACIDLGAVGGSACKFGNTNGTGAGHDYPANGCPVPGLNQFAATANGLTIAPNDVCLTDAQVQGELSQMISETGMLARVESGYTPLVTLLTPPGVVDCLDASANLCSANGLLTPPPPNVTVNAGGGTMPAGTYHVETTYVTAQGEPALSSSQIITLNGPASIKIPSPPAAAGATGWYAYVTDADKTVYQRQQGLPTPIGTDLTLTAPPASGPAPQPYGVGFCSYHSQVTVGATQVTYVVQPWTSLTNCDEPDAPLIPDHPPVDVLAKDVAIRLVSPLSQGELAAIVDPSLNGWYGQDGSEINDNGSPTDRCQPLANQLDNVTVNGVGYLLQREFNNGGVIASDPNALRCTPNVLLTPRFVIPSAVNAGDLVEFDGSSTASSLLISRLKYSWNFGDGTSAVGPSVTHAYAKGGTYTVKLTVTDRGGNVSTSTQSVQVLGPNGQTQPPPSNTSKTRLRAHIQLMPQGLKSVLKSGIAIRVTSNERANGFVTLSIPRAVARRAHIKAGHRSSGVVGRGTVAGIKVGTVHLHLRLSRAVTKKLGHLHHVALTVKLALVAPSGDHITIDAAGRY